MGTWPSFTSYNHANIPFAYPPLGFYVDGLARGVRLPTGGGSTHNSIGIRRCVCSRLLLHGASWTANNSVSGHICLGRTSSVVDLASCWRRADASPWFVFRASCRRRHLEVHVARRRQYLLLGGLASGLGLRSHLEAAAFIVATLERHG